MTDKSSCCQLRGRRAPKASFCVMRCGDDKHTLKGIQSANNTWWSEQRSQRTARKGRIQTKCQENKLLQYPLGWNLNFPPQGKGGEASFLCNQGCILFHGNRLRISWSIRSSPPQLPSPKMDPHASVSGTNIFHRELILHRPGEDFTQIMKSLMPVGERKKKMTLTAKCQAVMCESLVPFARNVAFLSKEDMKRIQV